MKISLRKFVEAYEGKPHQIAAIEQLADALPVELVSKFSDWVVCFEVDGEVEPMPPEIKHKGYIIEVPWQQ